MRKDGFGVKTL